MGTMSYFRRMLFVGMVDLFCIVFVAAGFAADSVKMGVAGPHKGELAAFGIPVLNAAKLVVGEFNAKGGILGQKVELLAEDDQCKRQMAVKVAKSLVSKKVRLVLGHICSDATQAELDIYNNFKIITISPSARNPALTQSRNYAGFFRTIPSDDTQARLQVDYVLEVLQLKKIAVLHDQREYGKSLAEYAKGFLERDTRAEVVLYESLEPGQADYSAVVRKLDLSAAEAVIFGGYYPEAAKIVTRMRKKRMDTIFISGDRVRDDTFIKMARQYAEGVYATGLNDLSKNPMAIAAIEAYRSTYGSVPGTLFLSAYAAMLAVFNAIENVGSTDHDAVVKALRSNYVETPLGKIRFDRRGDVIGFGYSVYQAQNGVFVELK